MILFLEYPPCSSCQKARKWLDGHGIAYVSRHIKEENPSFEELSAWLERCGMDVKKFFNTSGLVYRDLGLKDKLPGMRTEEQLRLLAADGMLVKRPVVVTENTVLTGFREKEWAEVLLK